jgi:hypothetical protein
MANFYNLETNEPIATMYIGSSRKGMDGLRTISSQARQQPWSQSIRVRFPQVLCHPRCRPAGGTGGPCPASQR